jgi:gamma-glutamylaminecyclotransferase
VVKLFALGTLKRGFALNYALDGAQYLGQYRSIECFPLVIAGPWYAPMLLNQPGLGRRIIGELYELNPLILARIDPLESIGRPGNYRIRIRVAPIKSGVEREAFAYAKAPDLATPLHSGYLDAYQDRRFIPPWQRELY